MKSNNSVAINPFFSICIPVYNGEKFLVECIDSALNQTFKNFEIILLDDHSSDNSFAICQDYEKTYQSIRAIRNEKNFGLVNNLNKAINLAKGDWVKILLQDDLLHNECLTQIYPLTKEHVFIWNKRSFIIEENANSRIIDLFTSQLITDFSNKNKSRYFTKEELSNLYLDNCFFNYFGEPTNVAFKKDIVLSYGFYDVKFKQLLDYEFCIRVTSNTGGYYINNDLSYFRIHSGATSNKNLLNATFMSSIYEYIMISNKTFFNNYYKSFRSSIKTHRMIMSNLILNKAAAHQFNYFDFNTKIRVMISVSRMNFVNTISILLLFIYISTIAPLRRFFLNSKPIIN